MTDPAEAVDLHLNGDIPFFDGNETAGCSDLTIAYIQYTMNIRGAEWPEGNAEKGAGRVAHP